MSAIGRIGDSFYCEKMSAASLASGKSLDQAIDAYVECSKGQTLEASSFPLASRLVFVGFGFILFWVAIESAAKKEETLCHSKCESRTRSFSKDDLKIDKETLLNAYNDCLKEQTECRNVKPLTELPPGITEFFGFGTNENFRPNSMR